MELLDEMMRCDICHQVKPRLHFIGRKMICDSCIVKIAIEKGRKRERRKQFFKRCCQTYCRFCDNDKGKFIYHWYRKGFKDNKGHWHIFCSKKNKFIPWDRNVLVCPYYKDIEFKIKIEEDK